MIASAEILAWLITLYVVCGIVAAPILAFKGLDHIDDAAEGSSLGFKLIVIPGLILFWPLIVSRVRHNQKAPTEKTPHKILWRNKS